MCIHNPKTTTLTFALGKMVVTGAKSEDDSWLALCKYARISMWLWISGQQTGSLVCTGVGIVFNVFGFGWPGFWKGGWHVVILCMCLIVGHGINLHKPHHNSTSHTYNHHSTQCEFITISQKKKEAKNTP